MLKIHFLNVGKGHCTIIDFPSNRLSMIDIDDSRSFSDDELDEIAEMLGMETKFAVYKSMWGIKEARSLVEKAYTIGLTDPIEYLQNNFADRTVFRFILTHPDMDHMSGFTRLHKGFELVNFWDTDNDKAISSDSWDNSPYKKEDWETYQRIRSSEESPKCLRNKREDTGQYWSDDGIEILSPTPELAELANQTGEFNHISYVLRITHRGKNIILPGDTTIEALEDILEKSGPIKMKSDILLAPHHGSKSCFCEDALDAISPDWIVVSVAVGADYAYQEYSKYGTVLSTKWYGNIVFTIDDYGNISHQTEYSRRE